LSDDLVPFGARIHELAMAKKPDDLALVFAAEDGSERQFTWRELDDRSTQVGRLLAERGLGTGDRVALALKNSPELVFAVFGGWKVGAVVVPMRWDLPAWELERLLAVVAPKVALGGDDLGAIEASVERSTEPLPVVTPPHSSGICSSGSTGNPKVILRQAPGLWPRNRTSLMIEESWGPVSSDQTVLVPGPMYHNNGFMITTDLLSGFRTVLMERFNAALAVDLIERHRVTGFTAATPMFQRIARLPGVKDRDFSSIEWTMQGAAVLPQWLARFWFDLIGAEHFYMTYGSSEGAGVVATRGDEWLEHPGTLGRGWGGTEVKVLDSEGKELPPGEVGEIYMRPPGGISHSYLGNVSQSPVTAEGFTTIGDLGWLDEDGFLFMADRRVDMIVTGGANVFPAEVEAALSEHPLVEDVVVIGLADEEWGRRVHAIVQLAPGAQFTAEDVIAFAKERLTPYKVPKSVEFVDRIPRTDAGKVNRGALVEARDLPVEGSTSRT
jgi:bile acid-coenzyme A ligase